MSRRTLAVVALGALPLLGATPGAADPSALLEAADAAFARGDYVRAEQFYACAEPRATDPGRVALGLAAAKYRLSLADPEHAAALLDEAERLYRCCTDPADPRRAEALVGLGNCLLRKAADRDASAAWSAAERFREAERDPRGAEFADSARHNLQLARLLGRQIPGAQHDRPQEPPPGNNPDQNPKPPDQRPDQQDGGEPGDGKSAGPRPAKADPGQQPTPVDGQQQPGEGELPPVPDNDNQPPLTARQAREHLDQAARRIMEEGLRHRRGTARPPAPGVPDW